MMKLYVYGHCPYCVKAQMIFGLKKIKVKIVPLPYDDEKTPKKMIGQKMLPILEVEKEYMPESLDIIKYIDQNFGSAPIVKWRECKRLNKWFDGNEFLHYYLAMPRWTKSRLPEFKTAKSKRYFQQKKEASLGSFKEALDDSEDLINQIQSRLEKLEKLFGATGSYFKKDLSVNDFHLFAYLRMLSVVKGIKFPPKTKKYLTKMSKKTGIDLHKPV